MSAYLDACYVGDGLYGIPSFHDLASSVGLCCRTDILEEVGADPAFIKTWDDVMALLDKVKEKYPNMSLLVPNNIGNGVLSPMMSTAFEEIEAGVGTIVGSDSTTVENLYASDEFKEICNKAYEWNKKGYFISDAVTVTETRGALVKAGNAFGYVSNIYPGFEVQESQDCGYNITCITIDPATAHASSVTLGQWVIPTACETPEKALAFVDLLYTNADIQNLFFYGIEGTDYVIDDAEKGIISYPEGKDSTTVGWTNQMWITGNATIGYKWSSQGPEIWEKCVRSCRRGFYHRTVHL